MMMMMFMVILMIMMTMMTIGMTPGGSLNKDDCTSGYFDDNDSDFDEDDNDDDFDDNDDDSGWVSSMVGGSQDPSKELPP